MRSRSSTVSVRPEKHGERVVEAAEIELRHHRIEALLDQEPAAFGSQLLADQAELAVGEAEAVDIVALASRGLGRKIWVAHCSTMVWAIGERSTSAGDWVPNTMKAFCLR